MYRWFWYCVVDVTASLFFFFFFASTLVSIPQVLSTPANLERTRVKGWMGDVARRERILRFRGGGFCVTKSAIKGELSPLRVSDRRLWWSPWQLFLSLARRGFLSFRGSSFLIIYFSFSLSFIWFFSFARNVSLRYIFINVQD